MLDEARELSAAYKALEIANECRLVGHDCQNCKYRDPCTAYILLNIGSGPVSSPQRWLGAARELQREVLK